MTDYKDRVSGLATDIDWSKAPEGATHFHPGNAKYSPHWVKKGYFCVTDFEHKGWVREVAGTPLDECVNRPTTPQWNGEGLPPVGVVCEHEGTESARKPWIEVEILAHAQVRGFDVAVFQYGDSISYSSATHFRPIKTQAKIAAEEREAAIQAMIAACPYPGSNSTAIDCAALYDAGLRFPKGEDQ